MGRIILQGILAMALILGVGAMAGGQPVGLTGNYKSSSPFTVQAGIYDLVNVGFDLAPGGKIPRHYHSGPSVVSILGGELTLIESDGTERVVKAGESFMENPNVVHAVENRSTVTARIAVSQLIPKGIAATTWVK